MLIVHANLKRALLKRAAEQAQILNLFANDHHPSENDILDDFVLPSGHLYVQQETPIGNWSIEEDAIVCVEKTMTPGCPVYGYFFTNRWGDVIWAERFPKAPWYDPKNRPNISVVGRLELT
jgi:hypothetical protein